MPGRKRGTKKTGGRKKGVANKINKQVKEKVIETGLTPLEVLIEIMRDHYSQAHKEQSPILKATAYTIALDAANKAAPYIHAKLSSIDLGNKDNLPLKMIIEWGSSE